MIYYQDKDLTVRAMYPSDCQAFHQGFAAQGWDKPFSQFERYFEEQREGVKKVLVAVLQGEVAGYTTLLPQAPAGPFAGKGWPEVCDFNVLEKFQRRGIGNRILEVAEDLASQTSDTICLGVGLHSGYGTAQRLYVKRGYVFDNRYTYPGQAPGTVCPLRRGRRLGALPLQKTGPPGVPPPHPGGVGSGAVPLLRPLPDCGKVLAQGGRPVGGERCGFHRALGGGRLPLPVPVPAKHRGHRRPGVGGLPGGAAQGLCLGGGAAYRLSKAVRRFDQHPRLRRRPGPRPGAAAVPAGGGDGPPAGGPRPCTSPPIRRWRARPSTRPWAVWRQQSISPPTWSRSPATASWSSPFKYLLGKSRLRAAFSFARARSKKNERNTS